jgi:hypothetical protein
MKQKKAAKRKGGKRKDRNTKGTSHSGMANTPTFQNFIYSIYSEKKLKNAGPVKHVYSGQNT